MYVQKICALSCVLALTACVTAQENPNYKYSSKYGEQAETTQSVSTANTQAARIVYVSPEMREAQLNNSYSANSESATAPHSNVTYANSAVQPIAYPETSPVVDASDAGTPGYGLYIPETVENYDYSENVVSANTPTTPDAVAVHTQLQQNQFSTGRAANYVVTSGDTIYNLSRRLCVNLEDIQSPNGVGNDFAIKIGQPIYLPQSRC